MRAALLMAAVTAAGAVLAGPSGSAAADSPVETIGLLEAQGYTVNVDRVGNAPLQECVVVSVRNPQTVTKLVEVEKRGHHHGGLGSHRDDHDDGDVDLVPVVVSRSISVSLNCAR